MVRTSAVVSETSIAVHHPARTSRVFAGDHIAIESPVTYARLWR